MANPILDKFSTSAALTITLASLASSVVGLGRQATFVDNSITRFQDILLFLKLKQGTSPTANKGVIVYGLRGDKDATTPHRTDGAGASDAAITILNAQPIGGGRNKSAPATGDDIYIECLLHRPGHEWSIAIVHDTVVALDATESNHWARWIGLNPEVQ